MKTYETYQIMDLYEIIPFVDLLMYQNIEQYEIIDQYHFHREIMAYHLLFQLSKKKEQKSTKKSRKETRVIHENNFIYICKILNSVYIINNLIGRDMQETSKIIEKRNTYQPWNQLPKHQHPCHKMYHQQVILVNDTNV